MTRESGQGKVCTVTIAGSSLGLEESEEQEISPPFILCSVTELLRLSTQTVIMTLWVGDVCEPACKLNYGFQHFLMK